jgi:putative membrane protein
MLREILGRVLLAAAWATAVVVVDKWAGSLPVIGDWSISLTLLGVIGSALGFLLVFRTNSAYDKFWEGRKLWGGIVNESRNLTRQAMVHLDRDRALRDGVVAWARAWPYTAMQRLRGAPAAVPGHLAAILPASEVAAVERAEHAPLAVAGRITRLLVEARDRGLVTDITLAAIDQNVQLLIDYLGGCERIVKTPLPFAYLVHVRRALVLYCMALPFALVQDFGWGTIMDTAVVTFIFMGIEDIGVEIENPFGSDENDLPLESICSSIDATLEALATGSGFPSAS